jgi:glycosyltransferase involved in cell wall biosynthesis
MSDGRLMILGPAARSGGSQRYVSEAIPRIVRGWDGPVTLVLPHAALDRLPADIRSGTDLHLLERPRWARGALHVIPSAVAALRLVRSVRPAVVLTLGNLAYTGPSVPTVVLLNNAVRVRDLRWPTPAFLAYVLLLRAEYRLTSWRTTRAIAVSAHLRDIMPRRLRGRRTVVVHHGVDVSTHGRIPSGGRVDTHGPLRILLPGSIVAYRGIERVLRALHGRLPDDGQIRVAGLDGPARYRRRIEREAQRLDLSHRLVWLGPLPHEELLQEMRLASHVIISSRTEACPNTLFEAGLVDPARPVIAFDDAWSVEYAPLLDGRVREDRLADVVLATVGGSEATTTARRQQALAALTWDRCAHQTLAVLKDVAHAR